MNSVKLVLLIMVLGVLLTVDSQKPANAGSSMVAKNCASVADLVDFVAAETGYKQLPDCIRLSVTTDVVLRSTFVKASAHGEEPLAAFARGEILLSPKIDISTHLGLSYLVHEIVHVFQFENQQMVSSTCPGLLESEAYRIQAAYLRKFQLPNKALEFELVGLMKGACANHYYR